MWPDAIRSIVIGQSLFIVALVIVNVVLTVVILRPRPGRLIGVILTVVSYIAALLCVVIVSFGRISKPPTVIFWLSFFAAQTGTLGTALLVAHIVFHSAAGTKQVKKWFGKPPE